MTEIAKRLFVTLCISLAAVCFQAVHVDAKSGTVVNVKVGNKSFECEFYDNQTANAFLGTIPVKYKMSELNGNEKYKYLDRDFPTDEKKVRRINAGDIMLYGSDCLVLFYKSRSAQSMDPTAWSYSIDRSIRHMNTLQSGGSRILKD